MSPDPSKSSAGPSDPGSWNRYAYTRGDPTNRIDPTGLEDEAPVYIFTLDPGPTPSSPGVPYNPSTEEGNPWNDLSEKCQRGLETAMPQGNLSDAAAQRQWLNALARAQASAQTMQNATAGTSIDWTLLAAIGVRETGFRNLNEADGAGVGVGVFQITVSPKSGVTAAQAGNLTWAANYAANLLASNMATLAAAHPNLDAAHLFQATAASYNFGTGNISGNPNTIDVGTAGNNYGSNVLDLMDCFR